MESQPTAAARVLQTYELLERILLFLPFHTLFTHQRVCKPWQSIIARSPRLREEMFLSPPQGAAPVQPLDTVYSVYGPNDSTHCIYAPFAINTNPACELIDIMQAPGDREPRGKSLASFALTDQSLVLHFDIQGLPVYETKILHEDASWRRMFLTQPPIVAVNVDGIRKKEPFDGSVTVWRRGGVRLGDLHDEVVRARERYWVETGEDAEATFERIGFCLFHPWTYYLVDEPDEGLSSLLS